MATRRDAHTARGYDAVGLALVLLVLLTALLRFFGGLLLPLQGAAPVQAEWAEGLYGLALRTLPALPPVLLLRRACRRAGNPFPARAAMPPFWLLLCLFIGAALLANLSGTLLQELAGVAPASSGAGLPQTGAGLVLAFLGSCVAAPVMEELLFRGGVQPLLRRLGSWPAALWASLLFTLMHTGLWDLPTVFLLGLLLALVREWTGRLWPCVLLHAANNALAFGLLLAQRGGRVRAWVTPVAACGALVLLLAGFSVVWRRRLWAAFRMGPATKAGGAARTPRLAEASVFIAGVAAVAAYFVWRLL